MDRSRGEEVLLLKAQLLADLGGILRVQDLGDVLCLDLRLDRVEVLGLVEGEQIELVVAAGLPQAQRVDAAGLIARDHVVDRDGADRPARLPHALAVFLDDLAAEAHTLIALIVDVAPRVFVGQPVIRTLDLAAFLIEFLTEDAVAVLDAIAERRHTQRGERIDEARSQTAEATIAQTRLVLGVGHLLRVETEFLHRGFELLGQARVQQRVAQLLAHQELRGQVANGLGVAVDHVLLGLHPGIHQVLAHGGRRRDVHIRRLCLLRRDALRVLKLITDLVRELRRGYRGLRCRKFGHIYDSSEHVIFP